MWLRRPKTHGMLDRMRKVIPLSLVVLALSGGTARAGNVVIATDLPLQGTWAAATADANRAAALLLERTGGMAGPHAVTMRTYDDSTATAGGWDAQACRDNAAAHAAAADEVAVMGPFNSRCAKIEVPVLNGAGGGPLAMISGSSADPGLVRPWAPGEPAKYYPAGIRSFGRVLPLATGRATQPPLTRSGSTETGASCFPLALSTTSASRGHSAQQRVSGASGSPALFDGRRRPAITRPSFVVRSASTRTASS